MENLKLTVSFVKKLVPGPAARYADTEVPGLQIRVMAKKVCYYFSKRCNYKLHEISLGAHPDITLEEARQMALDKLGALANYSEAHSVAGRRQPLVREAIDAWLQKQKNPRNAVSVMKCWACLYDKKIADLVPEDISSIFNAMSDTPSMANHAVKYLRAAFNHLFRSLRMEHPVPFLFDQVVLYPTQPRLRVMREDEAPKIIDALKAKLNQTLYADQAAAILLMIYTGQRKGRVLAISADQIDVENRIWHVPGNNIKLPVDHAFNEYAWDIVASRLVQYPSGALFRWRGKPLKDCRKTMATVCRECDIENLHIHDLRRSLGTWMLSSGASIEEVSKTLGHSSVKTTEQVYAHLLSSRGRVATTAAISAMLKGEV